MTYARVRTAHGFRHRVVAYLGELKKSERNGWTRLCRRLNQEQRPEPSLFDPPHYDDPTGDEPVLVKLKGIRLQRLRDFGDVRLALGLWRLWGLDTLLGRWMPAGQEDVAWATVAATLTIGRFCEPSRELHIADTRYRHTALEDLLGGSVDQVHQRRLYDGLDHLLPHKKAVERCLVDKDWHEVQGGVGVKLVPGPDGEETFILARSADRQKREKAMHDRFPECMEAGLVKLRTAAESGRSASARMSWKSAQSGIRRQNRCWPTSWFASWPTSCGKLWLNGCAERGGGTPLGR